MPRDKIIIIFGPPASGKGTQADMIAEKLNLIVISPGELLRHELETDTIIGKKSQRLMKQGKLVSDQIVEKLVFDQVNQEKKSAGFIFDGFPRSAKQQSRLVKLLRRKNWLDQVIALEISLTDRVAISRISGRRVCECGASYHLLYNPPKNVRQCDLCGKKLITREDDKLPTIKQRLNLYRQEVVPLFDFWKTRNRFYKTDGNHPIKKVAQDVVKILQKNKLI